MVGKTVILFDCRDSDCSCSGQGGGHKVDRTTSLTFQPEEGVIIDGVDLVVVQLERSDPGHPLEVVGAQLLDFIVVKIEGV